MLLFRDVVTEGYYSGILSGDIIWGYYLGILFRDTIIQGYYY